MVETTVTIDNNGRAGDVSFISVPSFAFALDIDIDVPGLGKVRVDIGYGWPFCYSFLPLPHLTIDRRGVMVYDGMDVLLAKVVRFMPWCRQLRLD
jgi:hypothetical protein